MAVRLVVLRALGLGDFLTAVPALRALARAYPEHERILLAPDALRPLVALLGDAAYEVADTVGVREPPRELPAVVPGADVAVNLHGRGPQSTALLRASGIASDPDDLDLAAPSGPAPHPGATVVHPGASAPARRWPAERWAAVARAAPRPVVVTAGPGEEALARAVARGGDAAVFAGDLRELAALVAGAARVLCADTGIAHLATALGTPSVVLFGPTSPARWGPPAGRPQHRALWTGRHGDPNAATPDPGLLSLQPHDVLEAIA